MLRTFLTVIFAGHQSQFTHGRVSNAIKLTRLLVETGSQKKSKLRDPVVLRKEINGH